MRLPSDIDQTAEAEVVVAGHICLDIIPDLGNNSKETLFVPGKMIIVGDAAMSTGGAVANTGLALHRLGLAVSLTGKIGDDLFGQAIVNALKREGAGLESGMIVVQGARTSYSMVVSPEGTDRIFWHAPGANDSFGADDVGRETLGSARWFHFGYPPSMEKMYIDGGRELGLLLSRIKSCGLTTSLDMSKPDPASAAGKIDWRMLLTSVLPMVDVFMPSIEETLFMLDRARFDQWSRQDGDLLRHVDGHLLSDLSGQLLAMGATAVVLKLGDQGAYVRTTKDTAKLSVLGKHVSTEPERWAGRELLAPCFEVKVAGTTGAGDCTIAGFISGLLQGMSLEASLTQAVAAGAYCVESVDAIGGIPSISEVRKRLNRGWRRLPLSIPLPGWHWDERSFLWNGPNDSADRS